MPLAQDPLQLFGLLFCIGAGVRLAPVVEPAGPVFADHARLVGAELDQFVERAFGLAGGEVHHRQGVRQGAVGEHVGAVGGEQQGVVEAGLDVHGAVVGHVGVVVVVGAVFVLDLHGDDRPAVVIEQRTHLVGHGIQIGLAGGEKARVAAAHADVVLAEQPGGVAAGFPLGAGVGAGPQDHVEALRGGLAYERGHVVVAGEVEPALLRLDQVPEHVGLHRVQAQCARLLQAVFPVVTRDALEMDGAGEQLIRLAVAHELRALGAEAGPGVGVGGTGGDGKCQREGQDEGAEGAAQHGRFSAVTSDE